MRISEMSDTIGNQALLLQAATVSQIEESGKVRKIDRTVDAKRLLDLINELDAEGMKAVEAALTILSGAVPKVA